MATATLETTDAQTSSEDSAAAQVIPLERESFIGNLEKGIFEITFPKDVYYNFYAMNMQGIWDEQPLLNRIIYLLFMILALVGQIVGVSGIWWAEVSGDYTWDDITLDLSESIIDRAVIFSDDIVYNGNQYYLNTNQNLSALNETVITLEALNISDNAVKKSTSMRLIK